MTEGTDTAALSFEDALKELERIVGRLESGDVPLDQAIDLYEQGDRLRKLCQARLDAAQARIEQVRLDSSGAVAATTPFAAG
ncbi:MAG: exodeoxyribonuclease VII small subunit [Alphaproteobacteria bacterium HGW-Alphaproteobacteria-16]|nr:MAG: exodeoxyribonuclease VII small subunit [Alphaproteobacteria bacterium HGW-Alphaproteobacteria-16]